MRPTIIASTAAATPMAGLLRIALAVVVVALLGQVWPASWPVGAYAAAGLAAVFGVLSAVGRPRVVLRERLARVVVDASLVGLLVACTGGAGSPFSPLFFLVALGMVPIETRARVAAATAAIVGAYLGAAVLAAGQPGLVGLISGAGFLALFCAVVGFLGSGMRGLRKLASGLSSTLAREIDRVETDEALISRFGPVLKVLSLEETLRWAAETAHAVGGGSYAHVATLDGSHSTVLEADSDTCPSWWHPSIQRLLLWSCREGETVRSDENVHGIEGFVAIPVGPEEGEKRGAVILGGKELDATEERALTLLAASIAPALQNAEDAPGGLDQLTGLPNRASLHRVLWQELSHGRALTVLVVDLSGFAQYTLTRGLAAGDALLRRVGEKLRGGRQRAFRHADHAFVVVLSGAGEAKARRIAGGLRQLLAEIGDHPGAAANVAVGFALAEGERDPNAVLGTALRAVEEARERADGVAGFRVGEGTTGAAATVGGMVEGLVEALKAKDPDIEEHLRAVTRLAVLISRGMSLAEEELRGLAVGGMLHDVGKIGIPEIVLHKPGRLTEEEYEAMKRHPKLGAGIVSPVRELAPALPVINHHHERFDGNGYPDGLRGEEIPLAARVVAVADAFDSMVRDRPYGYGISKEAALREIEDNSGTQFDPRVVRILRDVVGHAGGRRADSTG